MKRTPGQHVRITVERDIDGTRIVTSTVVDESRIDDELVVQETLPGRMLSVKMRTTHEALTHAPT